MMISLSPQTKKNLSQDFTVRRSNSSKQNSKPSPVKPSGQFPFQKRYDKYCCGHITQALFTAFLSDLQKIAKKINCHISQSFDLKTVLTTIINSVQQTVDQILYLQRSLSPGPKGYSISIEDKTDLNLALIDKDEENKPTPRKFLLDKMRLSYNDRKVVNVSYLNPRTKANVIKDNYYPCKTESSEQDSPKPGPFSLVESGLKDMEYPGSAVMDSEDSRYACEGFDEVNEKISGNCVMCQERRTTGTGLFEVFKGDSFGIVPVERTQDLINLKEQELKMRERLLKKEKNEFEKMLGKIRTQIETYNEEFEIREKYLEEENVKLCIKEKQLNQQLNNFKEIEEKLIVSKCELENIAEIFLKFESYFDLINRILVQTFSQKHKLEELFESNSKYFHDLEKKEELIFQLLEKNEIYTKENNIEEEFEINRVETVKNSENVGEMKRIIEMRKDLEEKLKILQAKEAEIDESRKEIQEANEENLKTVLVLRSIEMELNNRKLKSEGLLRRKIEKLKILKNKLSTAVDIG